MSELLRSIDGLVREGIQAYIGLLCCGEKERSRRLFSDVLQISSFAAGGPSARMPVSLGDSEDGAEAARTALARCMIYFTLRSVLASLLVLRATAYWQKVPALVRLHVACAKLSRTLGDSVLGQEPDEPAAIPVRT